MRRGGGGYKTVGGQMKFYPYEKERGGGRFLPSHAVGEAHNVLGKF